MPSRRRIWRFIERVRRDEATTVFFTTHYLEEAEICDQVAFLAVGNVVARCAPQALVSNLTIHMIEIEGDDLDDAAARLSDRLVPGLCDGDKVSFRIRDRNFDLSVVQAELYGLRTSVRWRPPNLNEVFMWITSPTVDGNIVA